MKIWPSLWELSVTEIVLMYPAGRMGHLHSTQEKLRLPLETARLGKTPYQWSGDAD